MSMTVQKVILVAASAVMGGLTGAIVALLVLPFIRVWRRSRAARIAGSVLLALLAFAIAFTGLSRLFVEAMYRVVGDEMQPLRESAEVGSEARQIVETWDSQRSGISRELWLRQLMPPFEPERCYTQAELCTYLNDVVDLKVQTPWGIYGVYLGVAAVSAAAAVLLARRYARGSAPGEASEPDEQA